MSRCNVLDDARVVAGTFSEYWAPYFLNDFNKLDGELQILTRDQ